MILPIRRRDFVTAFAATGVAPANAGVSIADGLNNKAHHDAVEKSLRAAIDECSANGCPNLIAVSGNRRGMSDAEGADNCVAFLKRVKAQAEDKGVTICFELLNSKIDHKDTMCDHATWIVEDRPLPHRGGPRPPRD